MSAAKYTFASDNTAGICPEAWQALEQGNTGFVPAYGEDDITRAAHAAFQKFFGTECEVHFVFGGTAANALALAALCQGYHGIVAAEESHVEMDECGAVPFHSHGAKLLLASGKGGKMDLAEIERLITKRDDVHFPKPRAISLSNSTELGTAYRPDEVAELCRLAKHHGMAAHMDGARFFNALASLDCHPADVTWKAGLDVLCCGGSKLGMAMCEAVVFFNRDLGRDFARRCKQAGQLGSKMRVMSAQWLRMLGDDEPWRRHARHGNGLARELARRLAELPGVEILHPVEANAVFARFPDAVKKRLKEKGWVFYSFIGGGSRLMCSWRVTIEDVEALAADAAGAC